MTLSLPCIKSVGPPSARIMLIGEAPGESEEQLGVPFVGYSGQLLNDMLHQAGILRSECYLTNVLFTRPPMNKLEAFLVAKSDPHAITSMPSLSKGRYLRRDFEPELDRLRFEIRSVCPNIIVALGNTAAWATIRQTAISKIRGTCLTGNIGGRNFKVLPTYHPAAILRQWELRPIVVADLMKAKREMEFPEVRRPEREIIVDPNVQTLLEFYDNASQAAYMAVDIETRAGQITCIGFAISKSRALVVPFVDFRKSDKCFWQPRDECCTVLYVQRLLNLPCPKIFQNGLYDLQYLRRYCLKVRNALHDTMILHHAMHPELLKGLGFMGSVYTNEPAWKLMRKRGEEQLKGEDE